MAAKVLVIAHRGYSGKFPENTLRAFKEAVALKAAAVELDVHLSKDFELVVTHDSAFGRVVKAPGFLSDYTADQLMTLDAGSHKGEEFKSEHVYRLTNVLDLINQTCLLNIEIKRETLINEHAYEMMVKKLLTTLKDYGLKNIIFSSFDLYVLERLRFYSSTARIAVLDDRPDSGPRVLEALRLKAEAYNVKLHRVTREQVQELQTAGLKVNGYTVKNQQDLDLAYGLGVDGIFADNLEEAMSFFKDENSG